MKVKNILLIDDNEVDNYITRQILMKSESAENIFVQSSGPHALKFLEETAIHPDRLPDYIFLDILMPAMDGFDFLDEYMKLPEAIRNHPAVFILTSSADKRDVDRAAQYPVVKKYLHKPIDESMVKEL